MSRAAVFLLALCTLFFAAGVLFAPLLGIENDESLFGMAIWGQSPIMLMTYLGALKGWLYVPLFHIWTPSPYAIRIPPVLMGAATVWIFFLLLRRAAGERVAVIGSVLLATDSLFFLTTVYDWGPVALQHLLTAGALLALVRFVDRQRTLESRVGRTPWSAGGPLADLGRDGGVPRGPGGPPYTLDLALAFFLAGLALWDKALSIWLFSAIGVATLAVYRRELRALWTMPRALVAGASFAVGASPLILYNLTHNFATLHQDSGFAPQEIWPKLRFLVETLNDGLFGWITRTATPWPLANFLGILFVVALALWPVIWKRNAEVARLMGFTLVVLTAAFLEMAVTHNAGASVHHTILLWPFPQLFVALALGHAWQKAPRVLCTAVVAIVAAHSIYILHSYRQDIREQGSTLRWTEGIFSLASFTEPLPTQYFILDWGMLENLVLLREGKLSLHAAWDPLIKTPLSDAEKQTVRDWVAGPTSVFLAHPRGNEIFQGCRENLDAITREMGWREVPVALIRDAHGQPVFEAFRFSPQ